MVPYTGLKMEELGVYGMRNSKNYFVIYGHKVSTLESSSFLSGPLPLLSALTALNGGSEVLFFKVCRDSNQCGLE